MIKEKNIIKKHLSKIITDIKNSAKEIFKTANDNNVQTIIAKNKEIVFEEDNSKGTSVAVA